jgi:(S)-2-hydroxyglutarate dehydrogenase
LADVAGRIVVIGGGIVGLATARRLQLDRPDATVTLLEKEPAVAAHQSGRNSGVIHSGVYYPPGSLKATLCRSGRAELLAFADGHDVAHEITGKLIVATTADEVPALQVPETGVIDYPAVCRALAAGLAGRGGAVRLGTAVTGLVDRPSGTTVTTTAGDLEADLVVNCAGLHSDHLHRLAGGRRDVRIVPFRGEYFELAPSARHLVRGLVYPVPDPRYPFLGVHLTRGVDGSVHVGPNAVLALAREGYGWSTVRLPELAGTLGFAGFRRFARRNVRTGLREVIRSLSRRRFAADVARLVPAVTAADLVPSTPGVRAQAITADGGLVDDFLIERTGRVVHVLNAPSPAATSAFAIARHIAAGA